MSKSSKTNNPTKIGVIFCKLTYIKFLDLAENNNHIFSWLIPEENNINL